MKRIFLLAAFVVAGLISAKSIDLEKDKKEKEKIEKKSDQKKESVSKLKKMQCYEWAMYVWCTDQFYHDTVCWGEGSGTATHEQAVADEIHNAQLLTEYICGAGTGSGWGN